MAEDMLGCIKTWQHVHARTYACVCAVEVQPTPWYGDVPRSLPEYPQGSTLLHQGGASAHAPNQHQQAHSQNPHAQPLHQQSQPQQGYAQQQQHQKHAHHQHQYVPAEAASSTGAGTWQHGSPAQQQQHLKGGGDALNGLPKVRHRHMQIRHMQVNEEADGKGSGGGRLDQRADTDAATLGHALCDFM
eukprot:351134-Chlamydomonas_euryale.AAC.9